MESWQAVAEQIGHVTGIPFLLSKQRRLDGGCINQAYCLEGSAQRYFVKVNTAAAAATFEAEAAALTEIARTRTVRVPRPVCGGADAVHAWLVLEFIELGADANGGARALGLQLAAMHGTTQPQFGWQGHHAIRATPQRHTPRRARSQ